MGYYGLFYKENGYFKSLNSDLEIFDEPGTAWTFKNQDEVMKSRFSFKEDLNGFQACDSFKDFLNRKPWQAYMDKDIKEFVIFELKINNFLGIKKHSYIKKAFPSLFPEMDSFPVHELETLQKVFAYEGVLAIGGRNFGKDLNNLSLEEFELNLQYDIIQSATYNRNNTSYLFVDSYRLETKEIDGHTVYLFADTERVSVKEHYCYNLVCYTSDDVGSASVNYYRKKDPNKAAYLYYSEDDCAPAAETYLKID
jgi:hypothetical protein